MTISHGVMRSADGDRFRAECSRSYMEHVRDLSLSVRRLQAEIESAREMLLPGAASVDGMPGSPTRYADAIPDGVADMQGLIADYCSELSVCVDEQREAHAALSHLSGEAGRTVLALHYVSGMTWERAAAQVGYSVPWTKEIARGALVELYDFLPPGWAPPRYPAV